MRYGAGCRHVSNQSAQAARAIVDENINLELLVDSSDEAALAQLQELHGVGRWTAEYILLRGLGRWHIFPGDDVGARNNLSRWLGLTDIVDYESVSRVLSRWKPYGGLIYFHLLLDRLADNGHVQVGKDIGDYHRYKRGTW